MTTQEIIVILDNIRSRENVGSIFRTSDAVGVGKLYLCGTTPCPPHHKISKTALGAELTVPWEYHKQTWRLLENLKKDGYQILALEKINRPFDGLRASKNIFKFRAKDESLALVVGNEVSGLSTEVLKRSSKVISIPMYGHKESLNVAVAFGIAVYQLSKEHN